MILLTCAKIPDGLEKNTLTDEVCKFLSYGLNASYIENIRERKNDRSACESLFALSILCQMIKGLPAPPSMQDLVLARGDWGKPYFEGSEIKFNISHSRGYVACALSDHDEVGVDIEASVLPHERAQKLARRYLCPAEAETVYSDPEIFPRLWSEKEALAKFTGESIGKILYTRKSSFDIARDRCASLHRFSIEDIPISLCTTRDYSTIQFLAST